MVLSVLLEEEILSISYSLIRPKIRSAMLVLEEEHLQNCQKEKYSQELRLLMNYDHHITNYHPYHYITHIKRNLLIPISIIFCINLILHYVMPKLKLEHSTSAVLLNNEGKFCTFLISTYCPPDERREEATEELRNVLLSINECY